MINNNVAEAVYEESPNPDYKGNILIECLPLCMEYKEFYSVFTEVEPRSRTEALGYEKNERDAFLSNIKHQFFIPNDRHYRLYRTIYNSLMTGYYLRKPIKIEVTGKLKSNYRNFHTRSSIVSESTSSLSGSLFGISGVGKTTAINIILSLFPGGLFHKRSDLDPFVQIPFIKLECPKDSSLKDLCRNFFRKIDELIGSDYEAIYAKKKETVDNMVSAMAKLTVSHQIGMIIVDEIQHLTNVRSNSADTMLNFFVNLNNTLKVPIFIIGTPESLKLFGNSHRLPRRWSGEGTEKWKSMPPEDEWNLIMKTLFKYQYTEEVAEYDENMASLFYYHSQGIIDRAVRIFIEAQKWVLFSKKKKLSIPIIEKIIEDRLSAEIPSMDALREKRKKDLSNYPDLFFLEDANSTTINYREFMIKKNLKESSIPRNFYSSMLKNLLEKHPNYDITQTTSEITSEYIKSITTDISKPSNKKAPKLIDNYIDGDLRKCYDDDNLHNKLLDNDSLLNVSEYFLDSVS